MRARSRTYVSSVVIIILGCVTSVGAAQVRDPAATSRAWTACMTSSTPARAMIGDCTIALETRDISPFHSSLLLTERGDAYAALRRFRAAIADYSAALVFVPGDEDALGRRALAHLHVGDARSADRDATAAIARYRANPANRSNGSADVIAGYERTRDRARRMLSGSHGSPTRSSSLR